MPPLAKKIRLECADKLSIENLCDDVLVEIFSYLDVENIKEAALVCKTWNQVIGSSMKIMRKFNLNPTKAENPTCESSRKHQTIRFEFEKSPWVFFSHSDVSQVRVFDLSGYRKELNAPLLMKTLSRMPLLKKLSLHYLKFTPMFNKKAKVATLSTLEDLIVNCNDCRILEYIEAPQVTELTVGAIGKLTVGAIGKLTEYDYLSEHSNMYCAPALLKFLVKTRKTLKMLRLGPKLFREFAEIYDDQQFKVEAFKVSNYFAVRNLCIEPGFNKFLLTQASTLKSLHLERAGFNFSDDVYKTIFNELPNLTFLGIYGSRMPVSIEFYKGLNSNLKLNEFLITREFSHKKTAEWIFRRCPNIESLVLDCWVHDEINRIAQYGKNIKNITLDIYNGNLESNFKFDNLRTLTLQRALDGELLVPFVKACTFLEHIDAAGLEERQVTSGWREALCQHPALKVLTYNIASEKMREIAEEIKKKRETFQAIPKHFQPW